MPSPHLISAKEAVPVAQVPSQANQDSQVATFSLIGLALVLIVAALGRRRLRRFLQRKYQVHRTIVFLQRVVALERLLSNRPLSRK